MKTLTLSDFLKENHFDLEVHNPIHITPYNLLRKNTKLDFDVIVFGVPLQRTVVWKEYQKQELILTLLKGQEIPEIYAICQCHYDKSDKVYQIIDGKQRLTTILDFMENKFPIQFGNDLFMYDHLDEHLQRRIWNCSLRMSIVYEYPDTIVSDIDKIKWFNLLNFSGTLQSHQHEKMLKTLINENQ
ncbi:gp117 [Sphingomonas phage PAU]|uniref:gp117 n=1 Tax=Sphingomonas phage PAU TaxID=1150991 RepID=UPI0002573268|nr:gp117 [Sphingomonas phage PAU]AFF28115.1 gp117 [Sphingomonas phage PAU]